MENENATTSQEAPAEITAPESAPETETTTETETAPADVSDQPEEVGKPRAEKRINELSKRLKAETQRADYWETINAQPVPPTEQPEGDYVTAEQIADQVIYKQQVREQKRQKDEANKELQRDINETLVKHPDLESNDRLSRAVFAYAQANNMRISDAADELKTQVKTEAEKVRKELLATQSSRVGVTTPQGGRVSSGEEKIDINSLSESEKAANWGKILESYQN